MRDIYGMAREGTEAFERLGSSHPSTGRIDVESAMAAWGLEGGS